LILELPNILFLFFPAKKRFEKDENRKHISALILDSGVILNLKHLFLRFSYFKELNA
jgi:hypothetical protein